MMHPLPEIKDTRTARCTVKDPTAFLRSLREIAAAHSTRIICFNADLIAGRIHAVAAVTRAIRAIGEGTAVSNTLEMESLLFAAGSRQCSTASSFGIHEGENRVCICCYPVREEIWTSLGALFRFTEEDGDAIDDRKRAQLREIFDIPPEEVEAAGGDDRIVDLVLERVALLQVLR